MRYYGIIFMSLLVIGTGYLRDSNFIHLNAQIGVTTGKYNQFDLPFLWSFMERLSFSFLMKLKWIFTLIYFIIYYFYALLIVKWFFHNRFNYSIVHIVFASILIISGIAVITGILFPGWEINSYYFARWLMGAGQSPLLIMILVLLFYAEKKGVFQDKENRV